MAGYRCECVQCEKNQRKGELCDYDTQGGRVSAVEYRGGATRGLTNKNKRGTRGGSAGQPAGGMMRAWGLLGVGTRKQCTGRRDA